MPTLEEIEDIEDIDNLDMDLAEFDPDLVTPVAPAKPKPQVVRSQDADAEGQSGVFPMADMFKGMGIDPTKMQQQMPQRKVPADGYDEMSPEAKRELKMMQIVYPCYFDKNRTVQEGRRLPVNKCVENPLAKTILDACRILKIPAVLEPEKSHPQDWGNPGRVRLGLKYEHEPTHPLLKSKKQAFNAISDYLKQHPTTLNKVKELPGPPELMNGTWQPCEIPRVKGFKMNTIVPLHSTYTMKHPETAGAYMKTKAQQEGDKPIEPKKIKHKIQRIRG